jgi:hypothetical protein
MNYVTGDVVRLFSVDATDMELTVTAPNGVRTIYPPSRSVRVPATQLGTWGWQWSNGDTGEFVVEIPREGLELIEAEPAPQIAPSGALRTSGL